MLASATVAQDRGAGAQRSRQADRRGAESVARSSQRTGSDPFGAPRPAAHDRDMQTTRGHGSARGAILAIVAAIIIAGGGALFAYQGGTLDSLGFGRQALPLPTQPSVIHTDGVTPTPALPRFGHVYLVVLENHPLSEITGGAMPYLSSLIAKGALATSYHSVGHPSQPNYLALFSGSTQGVNDDGAHDLSGMTLADQLEQSGRTWAVYAENDRSGCFTGATATDGRDGPGTYARKHNPAISFTGISGNPERCAHIQDLSAFQAGSADLSFIIPNLCHDAHDCPLDQADRWLSGFLPKILGSASFTNENDVLFITFDEGDDNHVLMLALGPSVKAGSKVTDSLSHYSFVRTVDDAWSLGCLSQACQAPNLASLFRDGTAATEEPASTPTPSPRGG